MRQPRVGAREHLGRVSVVGEGPASDVLEKARSSGKEIVRIRNLRHVPIRHVHASRAAASSLGQFRVPTLRIPGAAPLPRRHSIQARVHGRLQLGAIRKRPIAHSLRQHPVGARRHAVQHVPGIARGDAGRAAHEGVGAVADTAKVGWCGRVARVVLAHERGESVSVTII